MKIEEKKFIVIQMKEQMTFIVRDATQVSKLIGVHRNTVANWFNGEERLRIYKYWLVAKGWVEVKSSRGIKVKNEDMGNEIEA